VGASALGVSKTWTFICISSDAPAIKVAPAVMPIVGLRAWRGFVAELSLCFLAVVHPTVA